MAERKVLVLLVVVEWATVAEIPGMSKVVADKTLGQWLRARLRKMAWKSQQRKDQ